MAKTAPWKAARSGFGQFRSVVGHDDGKPVTIAGSIYDDEAQALIAAAPDLLWFAQNLFNGLETGAICMTTYADETLANVMARGRAAISKATP